MFVFLAPNVESDSPSLSGMQALLQGTLTADSGGCVRAKTAGDTVILVWPRGYTVRGDAESFEILDGGKNVVARSGTALGVGGGGIDKASDTWTERDCASGGKLWMVGKIDAG